MELSNQFDTLGGGGGGVSQIGFSNYVYIEFVSINNFVFVLANPRYYIATTSCLKY